MRVFVFAQVNVTGIVTDPDGVPLIELNAVEKGISRGTIMDVNDNFTIDVASSDSVFIFVTF